MLEPVVITVAIAGLSLVVFPRKFMRVAHVGYGLGLLFALWLLSQSLFVIHALCPWCLLVTISTVTVFSTITRVAILENIWNFSEARHASLVEFLDRGWGRVLYTVTYAVLILAIYFKYGQELIRRNFFWKKTTRNVSLTKTGSFKQGISEIDTP